MKLADLLANYKPFCYPGDPQWTWQQVYDDVWTRELEYMDNLADSVQVLGIVVPVLIDDQDRVRDGHHRIAVAMRLGLEDIPHDKFNPDLWVD